MCRAEHVFLQTLRRRAGAGKTPCRHRRQEAIEYALGMLCYSPRVIVTTNGDRQRWSRQHRKWLDEYEIPVHQEPIIKLERRRGKILGLAFKGASGQRSIAFSPLATSVA